VHAKCTVQVRRPNTAKYALHSGLSYVSSKFTVGILADLFDFQPKDYSHNLK